MAPASVALLSILVVALGLRLWGLERKSVWFDESMSVWFAELPLPSLFEALRMDVNPPLYYVLLHVWLLFGQGDAWLRLPSVVFGTLTVLVTALLGRALFGWRVGLLAGLLVAVSALQIDMSQEARAYALFSLLATASLWLLHRACTAGGAAWPGYAAVTALALYTHNFAHFLLAAEVAYLAFMQALRRSWDWGPVLGVLGAGVLFLPWLPSLIAQLSLVRGDYWIQPPGPHVWSDTLVSLAYYTPPGRDARAHLLLNAGRWLLLGLIALALASAWRRPRVLLPALAVGGPIALSVLVSWIVAPIFVVRYVAFTVPAFWIVVARGLETVPPGLARWLLAGVVLLCVLLNLPPLYGDPSYSRSDLRAAAALVRARAQPGDLVVHSGLFTEVPFAHYNRGQLEEVRTSDPSPDTLREAVLGRQRFWYVRDFGVTDPAYAETAEQEARDLLAGWRTLEQHRVLGVHVFLLEGPG
jgi:mannosyltransferase